jgi:hypothetical protein
MTPAGGFRLPEELRGEYARDRIEDAEAPASTLADERRHAVRRAATT